VGSQRGAKIVSCSKGGVGCFGGIPKTAKVHSEKGTKISWATEKGCKKGDFKTKKLSVNWWRGEPVLGHRCRS